MPATPDNILALDVGERRIGVAVASSVARLPRPLATLDNDAGFVDALRRLIESESAGSLVVGLPRGLNGQDTAQTDYVRSFVADLQSAIELPVHWQDEALTSQKAEAELQTRGNYAKADIDALAATYILEDYLTESPGTGQV